MKVRPLKKTGLTLFSSLSFPGWKEIRTLIVMRIHPFRLQI